MMMLCRTIVFLLFVDLIFAKEGSPKIVIVGAGASGIAAASRLLENGFQDVLILEAENRIGGRVYTTKFDDYVVDLGAQWVHGEKGNVAYDLAAPLGLIEHSSMEIQPFKVYQAPGMLLEKSILLNVSDFFMKTQRDKEDLISKHDGSVGKYFETQYGKYFAEHPEINEMLQKQLLRQSHTLLLLSDPAESWHDLSARRYSEFEMCEGDEAVNWKERGYSTILDILMKKIPNPEEELPVLNNTILKAEVVKVDYTSESGTVKLTTLDGKEYVADHVIMTPSLGVMKAQYDTLFDPPLPESKINSIKGLAFGAVGKIYLAFNEAWWKGTENESSGFAFLWNDDERQEYENDPNKRWLLDIVMFGFVQYKPHILLVWLAGKGARAVEDLPDEQVQNQMMDVLKRFISQDYNITEPTAMIRSNWNTNKHFRGTYSYRSLESERTNASTEQLMEPIMKMGKPVVLFAGEATNKNQFSTVHGAIGSGWREADRLIGFYNQSNSEVKAKSE